MWHEQLLCLIICSCRCYILWLSFCWVLIFNNTRTDNLKIIAVENYAPRVSQILVNWVPGFYEPRGDKWIQCHHGVRDVNAITDSVSLISIHLADVQFPIGSFMRKFCCLFTWHNLVTVTDEIVFECALGRKKLATAYAANLISLGVKSHPKTVQKIQHITVGLLLFLLVYSFDLHRPKHTSTGIEFVLIYLTL